MVRRPFGRTRVVRAARARVAALAAASLVSASLMSACASTGPSRAGSLGAGSTAAHPATQAATEATEPAHAATEVTEAPQAATEVTEAPHAAPEATEAARAAAEDFPPDAAFSSATVYVARRRWHIDVGFSAEDVRGPLVGVLGQFPGARYAFFGFGDRHYLLSKDHEASALLAALWPGPGLILLTAIEGKPSQAFGAEEVIELQLTPDESRAIQAFIWHSLSRQPGEAVAPYAPGPYPGSTYFAALPRYSGLHTCITWAAEALRAGGLPVRTRLTLVAGQLWRQILKLRAASAITRALPGNGSRAVASIAGRRVAVLADHGRAAALRDHDSRLGRRGRAAAADATGQQSRREYCA